MGLSVPVLVGRGKGCPLLTVASLAVVCSAAPESADVWSESVRKWYQWDDTIGTHSLSHDFLELRNVSCCDSSGRMRFHTRDGRAVPKPMLKQVYDKAF